MMSQNDAVHIKDIVSPAFYKLHHLVIDSYFTQFWLSGGRGSTKSSFIAIEIILGIMENPDANAICFRKTEAAIRDSLYDTFKWAINTLGVSHLWTAGLSPFNIVYNPTGQVIRLRGLDKPEKRKSAALEKGYFKYLWFEELAEFNGMDEVRNVSQSYIRGTNERQIRLYSYNPPREPTAWVNKEKDREVANRFIQHSTYLDVPPEWLGQEFLKDAKELQESDDTLYQCEYMGLSVGLTDSVVFNGKYVVQEFKPQDWWSSLMGADWGFANDPNVLVKIWIAPHQEYGTNCLYIEYAQFGYRVDNNDIPALYDLVPDSEKHLIRADCAAPATISQLKGEGYNIIAADKWPGSIEDGIRFLRSFDKIIIHPRCDKMVEEARMYSYKIDRITKDITTKLVDDYNHGWDSVRYALSKIITRKNIEFKIL